MDHNIYEETVFSKWMTFILAIPTTIFFFIWSSDVLLGWNWTDPPHDLFWLVMSVVFLGLTFNFSILRIEMNSRSLTVGYGLIKKEIPWERIEDCEIDEVSSLRYGGWGIRLTRVGGRWRAAYNVVGISRVVVSLDEGWMGEVAFSTKSPDKVTQVIKDHSFSR